MAQDIKDVQVIKGSIEILLEILREVYEADVAALVLVATDMHEDEKLFWFQERLTRIRRAYDPTEKEPLDKLPIPEPLKEYLSVLDNDQPEGLKKYLKQIEVIKFCFKESQNPAPKCPPSLAGEPKDRFWKYSYKKRPVKWVVFKEYQEPDPEKSILYEGLTAFAVRTRQKVFIADSSQQESYRCLTHLNWAEGITPQCKRVAFFPLELANGTVGLLKIENYTDIPEQREAFDQNSRRGKSNIRKVEQYLPALIKLLDKSQAYCMDFSYEKLYGVSPNLFLTQLKAVTRRCLKTNRQRDLFRETYHLLWVLHRKEYVGHQEIMTRVTNYADDVAGELGFHRDNFFKTLLAQRIKHEELMLYETAGYRDHFMHSFHVFLLGYVILCHIGFEQVARWIKGSCEHILEPLDAREITPDGVLRIWFLAAFFHDTCYVFERFGEGLSNFLEKEWGYAFPMLPTGIHLLETSIIDRHGMQQELPFGEYLGRMLEYFTCSEPTNHYKLLAQCLNSITKMNDHGVGSGLGYWDSLNFIRSTQHGQSTR